MSKEWVRIPGFPDYELDEWGSVRDRRDKAELAKHPIGNTYYFLMLDRDGNPKIRVVGSLMEAAFKKEAND